MRLYEVNNQNVRKKFPVTVGKINYFRYNDRFFNQVTNHYKPMKTTEPTTARNADLHIEHQLIKSQLGLKTGTKNSLQIEYQNRMCHKKRKRKNNRKMNLNGWK